MPELPSPGEVLLNVRLKQKPANFGQLQLTPRTYQKELSAKALKQNVIIYLGTGLGKTFIATLYLTSPQVDEMIQDNKKIVFLAPTQDLVKQQAEYMNKHLPYRVKVFCGRNAHCGEHIDMWSKEVWTEQLKQVDMLFCTPQIFASAISTNLLSWTQFSSVIFDEVHHACRKKDNKESGHPYSQIIAHYNGYFAIRPNIELDPRPRIIGLTASLINSMPKAREDIRSQVKSLENTFKAQCITDINVIEFKPEMIIYSYQHTDINKSNDLICDMIITIQSKFDEALKTKKSQQILKMKSNCLTKDQQRIATYHNRLKLAAAGFSIKPGSFPKVIGGLEKIRSRCGLWHLMIISDSLIQALEKHDKNTSLREDLKAIYNNFTSLIKVIKLQLDNFLNQDELQGLIKFTRPKCLNLLTILEKEYERTQNHQDTKSSFSCIVFVRSRLEVLAISKWLQAVSYRVKKYEFIKCDYAIGIAATMSSKYACITKRKSTEQHKMLENFRKGVLNVIITTSVLEEGIDLPTCSTVIRYDEPNTYREYVQSRGRARQRISTFYSLTSERNTSTIVDKLNKFNDFEFELRDILGSGDMNIRLTVRESIPKILPPPEQKEDFLLLNDNKVRISSSTAKTILNMYCQRLAKHTPFSDGVRFDRLQTSDRNYQTILYLPSGCPLNKEGVMGNVKTTPNGADNSAVVAAVKALYDAKELDENGTPARISPHNVDNLLQKFNLKPDFDNLEKQLNAVDKSEIDGKVSFTYEPQMAQIGDYLSKQFESKTYKLLRLHHRPIESSRTRVDTKSFFEKSVFGIIVDSSIPNEFVQTHLFGHYGEFKVEYEEISSNFLINNREHHQEYLNYTYKLLTKCLNLRGIKKEEFRYHCRGYIVLLDDSNRPDIGRMKKSLMSSAYRLKVNDIVKVRYYYQDPRERPENQDQLLLVKGIHNKNYQIRDYRSEQALVRLLKQLNIREYQLIEVIPISKTLAETKILKTKGREHVSTSKYYPEQCLDFFDDNPSSVFQAYNLPVQIFSLYKTINVLELDQKFINETKSRRHDIVLNQPISCPKELNILDDLQLDENNDRQPRDVEDLDILQKAIPIPQGGDEMEIAGTDDEDDAMSTVSTNDTLSSSEDEDEGSTIGKKYEDLIGKREMDLNDNDEDKFDKWNMSDYQEKDLKTMNFKFERRTDMYYTEESSAYQSEIFAKLKNDALSMSGTLVGLLMTFEAQLTGDGSFLDENNEFLKRMAKVDTNIISKVSFDKVHPFKKASRCKALLEALTLTRASETYNLESLENTGDSFLKYITSVVLYQTIDANEGFLTSARSRLVCNEHFTLLARKHNLGSYSFTRGFSKDYLAYILGQEVKEADKKPVSRFRPKNLADTIESLIGSYLIYGGEFEGILAAEWLGLDIFNESTFAQFQEKSVAFAKPPSPLIDDKDARSYYKSCKRKMSKFEEIIDYKFNDPSLLVQAFTHASSTEKCTRSYEKLEFLGDAVLDFLVTMNLVMLSNIKTPGQMTSSRSALVNNYSFAKLAIKYKYDLFLQHGSHDIYDELVRLRNDMDDEPDMGFLDMTDFDKIVKLLGDLFESVAGAIYLDSGCSLDKVWSIYYPMMKESLDEEIKNPTKNVISMMYETFPGAGRITYDTFDIQTSGGSIVGVRCSIKGFGDFEGSGLSQKQAKLRAVQEAMKNPPSPERKARMDKDFQEQYGEKNRGRQRPEKRGYQKPSYRRPQTQERNQQHRQQNQHYNLRGQQYRSQQGISRERNRM